MFVLPNGTRIDDEGIIKALKDDSSKYKYYLDILTGQVGLIEDEKRKIEKKIDKNRYFKIPKISESKKIEWARGYVKEMMFLEDELSIRLLKVLEEKKGGFNKFFKIIEKTDEIYGWPQWEYDNLCDEMDDWFEILPVDIEDKWEFDCDCAVCQAENFNQKYGRYPEPSELVEFMENLKNN